MWLGKHGSSTTTAAASAAATVDEVDLGKNVDVGHFKMNPARSERVRVTQNTAVSPPHPPPHSPIATIHSTHIIERDIKTADMKVGGLQQYM